MSSWMCSSTSLVITPSNVPSANGSRVASPRSTPTKRSVGISPASTIAANVARVLDAPRRRRSRGRRRWRRGGRSSNAWRPKPAPASSTRSPGRTPESIEADRQHAQSRPFRRSLSTLCGIASTSRYCSTVSSAQCLQLHRSTTRRRPAAPIAGAQLGVVEAAADGRGQRVDVAGLGTAARSRRRGR